MGGRVGERAGTANRRASGHKDSMLVRVGEAD
jgi:hypothetical protein